MAASPEHPNVAVWTGEMPIITVSTDIRAEPELCFDLARSVEAHLVSTGATQERAVAGVTTGLLAEGDEVTWRARHLGVTQELTSRITVFDRPRHFRDEMVKGVFAHLLHDHYFVPNPQGTEMRDVLNYASPLGVAGRLADRLFVRSYLSRFLTERAGVLKRLAESQDWKAFVDAG